MTQKSFRTFKDEIYLKAPEKNYVINKTDVCHIDDNWSSDLLDLKDYGPQDNRGYKDVLVMIENFSKFGGIVPLKIENAQTIQDTLEKILESRKRKPKLFESDRGQEFCNNLFQNILDNINKKHSSRNTSLGAVFAEKINVSIRDLPK